MNEKKQGGFKLSYLIVFLVVVLLICLLWIDFGNNGQKIEWTDALTYIENTVDGSSEQDTPKVSYIYFKNGTAYLLIVGSDYAVSDLPNYSDYYFSYDSDIKAQFDSYFAENPNAREAIGVGYAAAGVSFWDILVPILYICFAIFVIWMIYKMIAGTNKGALNFGKTKVKSYSMSRVKFDDIAGMEEEKAELQEIVEFLKNPKKFTDLGARIPKGVLLVGRPGTGKTLLARAVAGESKVPFISISGSDFVEMFVGVGASRVRDLFDQAKKNKPCIVFIDEIDAVGRQRGAGLGGGNDEREQTLNQLLVEMDGFESNEGIIVLAATNRSDILDPALMRPGRFDRQIYVHIPDVKGREGILRIHARNKPIDESVDFSVLARITSGFTGADIENMLNESAILAARAGRPKIIMEDITEGINKVIMGPQKKSHVITKKERKLTAYHESGHAILAKSLKNCDDVQEVSIIPRGSAGGYTMSRPETDDLMMTVGKANDTIAMSMGGRVAEEIIFKDITSGAYSDIQQATKIARAMVYEWGMSKKIGFLSLASGNEIFIGRDYQTRNDFSEKLAGVADDEIMAIMNKNYKRAKEILTEKIDLLHEMAKLLMERETIYKEEVDMIMEGKKTEEIITIMDAKEKLQKEKEDKIRAEKAKYDKLKAFEAKIKEGEKLVSIGVLAKEELDAIKKEYEAYKKEVEHSEETTEVIEEQTDVKESEIVVETKEEDNSSSAEEAKEENSEKNKDKENRNKKSDKKEN